MSRPIDLAVAAAGRLRLLEVAMKVRRCPPVILMYHGVTSLMAGRGLRNCEGKHTPVALFDKHLQLLRRSRRVIALREMVDGLANGQDLSDTVAITFDDGYLNNVLVAAPVLAEFNMTATFFLTTSLIDTDQYIWPDQLETALDRTVHRALTLPGMTEPCSLATVEEKRSALRRIKQVLKVQSGHDIGGAVEQIVAALDVSTHHADGDYRFMSWDQARELRQAGFDIGAHTVTHPILSKLPLPQAEAEILESQQKVREEVGDCSTTFCFPNGKLADFNTELQDVCRSHFKAALSTERGAASARDMFALKRLSPAGVDGGENIEWMLLRTR